MTRCNYEKKQQRDSTLTHLHIKCPWLIEAWILCQLTGDQGKHAFVLPDSQQGASKVKMSHQARVHTDLKQTETVQRLIAPVYFLLTGGTNVTNKSVALETYHTAINQRALICFILWVGNSN